METTLSDQETRFLLGEMIKASSIDVPVLAEFIKSNKVEQNWMLMQLPVGRNMYQCMGAVEKILPVQYPPPPNLMSSKRKSSGDLSDQPTKRPAPMILVDPHAVLPPRNIQPRPAPNGYAAAGSTTGSISSLTSTGKKRGRPSKADKEAQARANSARTMEFTPITPAPLAPVSLAPQREYASSPGYEVAGASPGLKLKKGARPGERDKSPGANPYPFLSPASAAETPRAPPDPVDQAGKTQSSREFGVVQSSDSRSPAFHQPLQRPASQPQSSPRAHTLPPIHQVPRPPPPFESYRGEPVPPRPLDPIFPDRDRSRSAFDPVSRDTPPISTPVTNRT